MVIGLPNSADPRLGPGCEVTVAGMTGAAAGHKLAIIVTGPSHVPIYSQGGAVIPGSSGQGTAMLSFLSPGYTTYTGIYHASTAGLADGAAIFVDLVHYDAAFSLLETVTITGRVWDPVSFVPRLLQALQASQTAISADLAAILAAVRHTYSSD